MVGTARPELQLAEEGVFSTAGIGRYSKEDSIAGFLLETLDGAKEKVGRIGSTRFALGFRNAGLCNAVSSVLTGRYNRL